MYKRFMTLIAAGTMAFAVGACTTPGERAVGGALIGWRHGRSRRRRGYRSTTQGALVGGALGAGGGRHHRGGAPPRQASGCPGGLLPRPRRHIAPPALNASTGRDAIDARRPGKIFPGPFRFCASLRRDSERRS